MSRPAPGWGRHGLATRFLPDSGRGSRLRMSTGWAESPAHCHYVYAGLGDKEQAFPHLHKAVEVRSINVLQMSIEPVFDGLRSDPRFGELLKIVGPPGSRP